MKLNTETIWRGTPSHHRESLGRRHSLWLTAVSRKRTTPCYEGESNDNCYSPAISALFENAAKRSPSVSIDREIMEGQPCITGTRIPVRSVLRALELYGSLEGVKSCYPELDLELVKDALYFSQIVLELPRGVDEAEVAY